jgi:serine/threonine-protein kinase RsbW/stage II sporulation protein AB (anti-sigma F factor)
VALCVTEAVTNAVLHAYRDGSIGDVDIAARITEDDDERTLSIEVSDAGGGMMPRADSPGLGMGLAIIAATAASLDIDGHPPGCCVRMTFPCALAEKERRPGPDGVGPGG